MSKLLQSPAWTDRWWLSSGPQRSVCISTIRRLEGERVCDTQLWNPRMKEILCASSLHICPRPEWLIILGILIKDAPRRWGTNKGLCLLQTSPLSPPPFPVFHLHTHRAWWAPLWNLTDHRQKIISETSVINFSINRTVFPIFHLRRGAEFTAKALVCTTRLGLHGAVPDNLIATEARHSSPRG